MTSGKYRDFEMRFEWKIAPGGNSGVKYLVGRSQKLVFEGSGPPTPEGTGIPGPNAQFMEVTSGMEYQIVDDDRHPDGQDPVTRSGSLYQLVGVTHNVVRPAGEINQSQIVMNGNRIEHWLNGVRVVSIDVETAEFRQAAARAPGRTQRALQYLDQEHPIALQSHTGHCLVPQHQDSPIARSVIHVRQALVFNTPGQAPQEPHSRQIRVVPARRPVPLLPFGGSAVCQSYRPDEGNGLALWRVCTFQ
jgi:hypothetical protein